MPRVTLPWVMEQLGRTTLPWDTPLKALSVEQLRALAAQVEELEANPAWQFIAGAIGQKVADLSDSLLPPQVHEHAAYIGVTNQIFGMRIVIDCPTAIRVLAQRREDDERKAAEQAARRQEQR